MEKDERIKTNLKRFSFRTHLQSSTREEEEAASHGDTTQTQTEIDMGQQNATGYNIGSRYCKPFKIFMCNLTDIKNVLNLDSAIQQKLPD